MDKQQHEAEPADSVGTKEFLESIPPGQRKSVFLQLTTFYGPRGRNKAGIWPELDLHCDSEFCDGPRIFELADPPLFGADTQFHDTFLKYRCKNCEVTYKTFALSIIELSENDIVFLKLGEDPPFGPPLSRQLAKLAGESVELLKKGRRCENQGLGVAAFAYYRRVVEEQKNRIFDQIIKVVRTRADTELIEQLEAAKTERRFTQGIEKVKKGLPEALQISGHNPLTLLHNALSEGLHAATDEECLEMATSIRQVLSELLERIDRAVKDDVGLNKAVGKLLQVGKPK